MAKYSTGGVDSGESDSCELCGAESGSLESTTVAGAVLEVCEECRRHGEGSDSRGGGDRRGSRGGGSAGDDQDDDLRGVRAQARIDDARKGDPDYWEEGGTDYEDDPLPYLVRDYGDRLTEAREEADLTTDELAGELGVTEAQIVAVEQGRATSAGVGGSLVEALEERLNVQLAEDA